MEACNIQKMREAFDKIGNACAWVAENCNDQQTAKYMNDVIAIVQSAIASPPRNCDKYPDFNDAITTLAKKRGWTGTKWDSERYCILANWLLAPVDEGDEA